jgi:hypothetical protein
MKRAMKALLSLFFATSSAAYAGLIGDEVQARWIYAPSFDQINTFVVGPGTELLGTWGSDNNLDVGDDYIDITIPYAVGIGSGVNWHFSSLDYGGIEGFTVATNFSGWSDSWLSFTSDSIDIAFLNLVQFPSGEGHMRITLLPASAQVPEPSPSLLLLLVLIVFTLVARGHSKLRVS